MTLCADPHCGCALAGGSGVVVTGSGTSGDPWVIHASDPVDLADIQDDLDNLETALASLTNVYVELTGDTMTGMLLLQTPSVGLRLIRTSGDSPFIEWYGVDGTTRFAFAQATSTLLTLNADAGHIRLNPVAGSVLVFKATPGLANTGVEFTTSGTVIATRPDASQAVLANKTGAGASASGSVFCSWQLAGTQIGSITRNTTTSAVLYNVSSDEDIKENFEAIDDDLALLWMRLIEPQFFNFKGHPEALQVGYVAQPAIALWPNAEQHGVITPGHGDVADRTWDDEGNEVTPHSVWEGWQMDYGRITPFIHSALQALDRVVEERTAVLDDHTARISELEAIVAAQADRLTALEAAIGGESVQESVDDAIGQLRAEVFYTRQMTAGWQYSNTAGTPPAAGQLRSNTPLTNLYVNKVDTDGFNRSAALNYIVTSTLHKPDSARIRLRGANGSVFEVLSTGAATDNGTWISIPVRIVAGNEGSKGTRIEMTMLSEIWAEEPPPLPTQLPAQPQPDIATPQDSGS